MVTHVIFNSSSKPQQYLSLALASSLHAAYSAQNARGAFLISFRVPEACLNIKDKVQTSAWEMQKNQRAAGDGILIL